MVASESKRDWKRVVTWVIAGWMAGALFTPISREIVNEPALIALSVLGVGALYAAVIGLVAVIITAVSRKRSVTALPFRDLPAVISAILVGLIIAGFIARLALPTTLWSLALGAFPFYKITLGGRRTITA